MQWIYKLAQFFGYWSFTIDLKNLKSSNSPIMIKWWDWFRVIVALTIYVCGFCVHFKLSSIFSPMKSSFIEIILDQITVFGAVFVSIATVIMDLFNRNILRRTIYTIHRFDEKV